MKRTTTTTLLAAGLALGTTAATQANTTLLFEDFEGNGSQFTTPDGTGTDGDEDYFAVVSNDTTDREYTSVQGTQYFGAQDIDDGDAIGQDSGRVLFEDIDITGFTDLRFSAFFAEQRPEAGGDDDIDGSDFARVEYQIDDNGYQNLLVFENDGETFNTTFLEDTDFDGVGDGQQLETAFAQFTKDINGTGKSLDLLFTLRVDSADEDIAFDNVSITGIPEPTSVALFALCGGLLALRRQRV